MRESEAQLFEEQGNRISELEYRLVEAERRENAAEEHNDSLRAQLSEVESKLAYQRKCTQVNWDEMETAEAELAALREAVKGAVADLRDVGDDHAANIVERALAAAPAEEPCSVCGENYHVPFACPAPAEKKNPQGPRLPGEDWVAWKRRDPEFAAAMDEAEANLEAEEADFAAAPADGEQPKDGRCDFEVYMNGEVVDVQHMSAVEAEERVNEMRATMPGFKVDWHYVAGRAVFKRLPLAAPAEEEE